VDEEELLKLEARYCSAGDTAHYREPPKVFHGCDGVFLVDGRGRRYLDLQMCYSAANFGYRNQRVEAALLRQLAELPQLAPDYLHPGRVLLAAELAGRIEPRFGKGRVHFEVGGAQAVEAALKAVRNACGGKGFVFAFEGGYHGRTLGTSAISSSYRYRRRFGHFGDRAQFIPFPCCFRCPYGKKPEDCGLYCVGEFARVFDSEYHGVVDPSDGSSEFSAFIVEPVQGTGGYVIPPAGYFPALKKILDDRGILLIDDEIQMGFYRTGTLWAIEHFGVRPDLVVFGKSLTNGLNPLSGIWARDPLLAHDRFPPGSSHSTFAAHPLGTAPALEVLGMLDDAAREGADYGTVAREKGAYFLAGLRKLLSEFPSLIGHVDGLGLALRVEVCAADGLTPDRAAVDEIVHESMKGDIAVGGECFGLVLDVGGYYKNVLTLAPALTISREEIDLSLTLLREVFWRVRQSIR
jgi:4-aminobutyrate aminotransferase-like enzyme